MSARQAGPYDAIARKWLALAERRTAHLMELRETGRWRLYLTKAELESQLREMNAVCERFAAIAGIEPQSGAAPANRGRGAVSPPPSAGQRGSRLAASLEAALELALSAAAELQESAAKSAA
jgi:hypothetical protein